MELSIEMLPDVVAITPSTRYSDNLVLTTKNIAMFYGCSVENIRDNFRKNRDRFTEGKHYFKLEGEELRKFRDYTESFRLVDDHAPSLYLWTKLGAALHAKMLNNDRAWNALESLLTDYFDRTENTARVERVTPAAPVAPVAPTAPAELTEEDKRNGFQSLEHKNYCLAYSDYVASDFMLKGIEEIADRAVKDIRDPKEREKRKQLKVQELIEEVIRCTGSDLLRNSMKKQAAALLGDNGASERKLLR